MQCSICPILACDWTVSWWTYSWSHFQFLVTVELETSNEVLLKEPNKWYAMKRDPWTQQCKQWTRAVTFVSVRELLGTSTLFLGPTTQHLGSHPSKILKSRNGPFPNTCECENLIATTEFLVMPRWEKCIYILGDYVQNNDSAVEQWLNLTV